MDNNQKTFSPSKCLALAAFLAYGIALITIEWRTSQDHVRNYFTDISGPVTFQAVNTSLSVGLMAMTSLLFLICLRYRRIWQGRKLRWWFYLSQAIMFAELAFDDRFEVHEKLSWRTGIGDHWFLVASAVIEAGLLGACLGWRIISKPAGKWLFAGALMFVVMIAIDALGADKGFLRLSLEDLAKTLGTLCLAFFAWEMLKDELDQWRDQCLAGQ